MFLLIKIPFMFLFHAVIYYSGRAAGHLIQNCPEKLLHPPEGSWILTGPVWYWRALWWKTTMGRWVPGTQENEFPILVSQSFSPPPPYRCLLLMIQRLWHISSPPQFGVHWWKPVFLWRISKCKCECAFFKQFLSISHAMNFLLPIELLAACQKW